MKQPTRVLGVDYGTKRVGLAVSDPARRIASPLAILERQDHAQDARRLQKLIEDEGIALIVVGLPIYMSGHEGGKAAEARSYGTWLQQVTGLPVRYWDERLTTAEAEQAMLDAGLTSKRRKARRDMVAAQILLQSYLEAGCPEAEENLPLSDQ